MTFTAILKDIFSDVDGHLSSKRVITAIGVILLSIGFIANLFFNCKMDQFIYDKIMDIVSIGLGMTGLEKFTGRPSPPADGSN